MLVLSIFLALSTAVACSGTSGNDGSSSTNGKSSNGASASNSGGKSSNNVLTWASNDMADTFDPALASSQPQLQFATATYEALVQYDSKSRELMPGLAASWEISDDSKTISLKLQQGVKFHDGSALTGEGVIKSLQRTIDIGKGESSLLAEVDSMTATGDDSLDIKLNKPDLSFIYGLQRIFIASAQAIDEHAGSDNGLAWFADHEAGSGPYMLKSFQPASQIVLTQFPDYRLGWDGDHVAEYVINVVDPATQVLQIKQGTADIATAIPTDDAYAMSNTAGVTVNHDPGSPFYLLLNAGKAPFDNPKVREAISMAVNYDAINQEVMHGWAGPLAGPIPDWVSDYDTSLVAPSYALEKAKDILAEAGYDESNPLEFSFLYFSGWTFEETIATILQADLAKIGVKVNVQGAPWATFTEQVGNPDTRPDMAACAVYVPTPTAGPVLTASFDPASEGDWAYLGYNNPEVTDVIHSAKESTDPAEQQKLYVDAQKRLVDDHAAIWLMVMPDVFVTTSRVAGLEHDPSWGLIPNYYGISLAS